MATIEEIVNKVVRIPQNLSKEIKSDLGIGRDFVLRKFFAAYSERTLEANFSKKLFSILFKIYRLTSIYDDIEFPKKIDKTFFSKESVWELFYKTFKSNTDAFSEEEGDIEEGLIYTDIFYAKLTSIFKQIHKSRLDIIPVAEEGEEIEEAIEKEFMGIDRYENYYRFNPELTEQSFIDFLSIEYTGKTVFGYNENIEITKDYNPNNTNILESHKVVILSRVFGENEKITVSSSYMCPTCHKEIPVSPFLRFSANIGHMCPDNRNEKNKPMFTKVTKTAITPDETIELFLYECILPDSKDRDERRYFYSLDADMVSGLYLANLIHLKAKTLGFTNEKIEYAPIILANKRITDTVDGKLIIPDISKPFCESIGMPHVKFMDVLFSIIKYQDKRFSVKIDKRGRILQIMLTVSGLARILFGNKNFTISVIGDSSIAKTFIGARFCPMLDDRFHMFTRDNTVSLAGLQGGIDTSKKVNNVKTTFFEAGIMTYSGLTVFDEAQKFFSQSDLNQFIKDIANDFIVIGKIGGGRREVKFTPIFFSNFIDHHMKYLEQIIKVYRAILLDEEIVYGHHTNDKAAIIRYINRQQIYLPIEYYYFELDNKPLARAIKFVRESFKNQNIDWKSGGRMESANRIIFDIVVQKNGGEELYLDDNFNITNQLLADLPVFKFKEEILEYLGFSEQMKLYDGSSTDMIKKEYNISLKNKLDDIRRILEEEVKGKEIVEHYRNNSNLDNKQFLLVKNLFLNLQLMENKSSPVIEANIKAWAHFLLLKTKRGLTEKEYNCEDNDYVPRMQSDVYDKGIDLSFDEVTHKDNIIGKKIKEEVAKIKDEEKRKEAEEEMIVTLEELSNDFDERDNFEEEEE